MGVLSVLEQKNFPWSMMPLAPKLALPTFPLERKEGVRVVRSMGQK